MALDKPHGVPLQVVVDDFARLVQVDAFGENVCRDEDVVEVGAGGCAGGLGGKGGDAVIALVASAFGGVDGVSYAVAVVVEGVLVVSGFELGEQRRVYVRGGVGELGEDDHLALISPIGPSTCYAAQTLDQAADLVVACVVAGVGAGSGAGGLLGFIQQLP